MVRRLKDIFKAGQSGFTLLEMILALAIISFVTLGVTIANAQIMLQTSRNTDFTVASRQALNAAHWISRDAQMSHSINGTSGFPQTENLTIEWEEWDNTEHLVVYSLQGNQLIREYSVDGGATETTLIADYINPDPLKTYTTPPSVNNTLTIKITSSVGQGDRVVDFAKEFYIVSRPGI
jgi:prepilin-type N-terminal cleavage/methylation domain-containing protein